MIRFSIIPLALLIGGCASQTSVFDARACPRERVYSKAEQAKIADALEKSPTIIQGVVTDYGKLRDKARACRRAG